MLPGRAFCSWRFLSSIDFPRTGRTKKRDTRYIQMSLLTLDKRDGERAFRPFPKMPPKNYFFNVATPSAMRLQPSTT